MGTVHSGESSFYLFAVERPADILRPQWYPRCRNLRDKPQFTPPYSCDCIPLPAPFPSMNRSSRLALSRHTIQQHLVYQFGIAGGLGVSRCVFFFIMLEQFATTACAPGQNDFRAGLDNTVSQLFTFSRQILTDHEYIGQIQYQWPNSGVAVPRSPLTGGDSFLGLRRCAAINPGVSRSAFSTRSPSRRATPCRKLPFHASKYRR